MTVPSGRPIRMSTLRPKFEREFSELKVIRANGELRNWMALECRFSNCPKRMIVRFLYVARDLLVFVPFSSVFNVTMRCVSARLFSGISLTCKRIV